MTLRTDPEFLRTPGSTRPLRMKGTEMRFPFTHHIERGDDEIELAVVYDVSPFIPARIYGDYPQPAEGGEVEIISVRYKGQEFTLTDAEEVALQAACEERAPSDVAEERAEAAEWQAQCARDDAMMRQ